MTPNEKHVTLKERKPHIKRLAASKTLNHPLNLANLHTLKPVNTMQPSLDIARYTPKRKIIFQHYSAVGQALSSLTHSPHPVTSLTPSPLHDHHLCREWTELIWSISIRQHAYEPSLNFARIPNCWLYSCMVIPPREETKTRERNGLCVSFFRGESLGNRCINAIDKKELDSKAIGLEYPLLSIFTRTYNKKRNWWNFLLLNKLVANTKEKPSL